MKTYTHFCAHLERNSLNIHGSDNVSDKHYREKLSACYGPYTYFCKSNGLGDYETKGTGTAQCGYGMSVFHNFLFLLA
jgi:hypothetical protein